MEEYALYALYIPLGNRYRKRCESRKKDFTRGGKNDIIVKAHPRYLDDVMKKEDLESSEIIKIIEE